MPIRVEYMKRKNLAAIILGCLTATSQAQTINSVTLFNSQNPDQIWITWSPSAHWMLGVSEQPFGPILNRADASVSGISQGNYWLYADPAKIGVLPQLEVKLSDGNSLSAVFQLSGTNGTAQSWKRISGSSQLELGWAEGVVDLVGTYGGVQPNGINDFYLYAKLGTAPVPEPHSAVLALLGITMLVARVRPVSAPTPRIDT